MFNKLSIYLSIYPSKNLQIQTIYPTLDEKRVFKDQNPKIKCSVFGLISEGDLERLLARKNDKRRSAKQVNYSDDSADEIDGPQLAVAAPERLCLPPPTPAGQATQSTPASTSSCQTPTTPYTWIAKSMLYVSSIKLS